MNSLRNRNQLRPGQRLRIVKESAAPAIAEPKAPAAEIQVAKLEPPPIAPKTPAAPPKVASPAPSSRPEPNAGSSELGEAWDANEESATDPSPGLLADPSDYTIGRDGKIIVQPNETLGHYAEWLGLRVSRLRQLNGLRYGEPVDVHQRLRLDFSQVSAADFERVRVEYHRELQEDFFAEWEIEGTAVHKVGPGDSIWTLSTRRFAVPIWLLRQYNPDVDLDALSAGTQITVPKLRQRSAETSARDVVGWTASAG